MRKAYLLFLIVITTTLLYAQQPQKEFFAGRRAELYKKMQEGVLIIAGQKTTPERNSDSPKRQLDNFWYFTGCNANDLICLLAPKASNKYVLFVKKMRMFPGRALAQQERDILKETIANFGADTAYYLDDFEKVVKRYVTNENKVYCEKTDQEMWRQISGYLKDNNNKKISDGEDLIAELRIIKTPEEIDYLLKAAKITSLAQIEAMKAAKPKLNEKVLEAIIDYVYKTNWASGFGFQSIVGSGKNSLSPHYFDNNKAMENGDVCVMDIGAAYNGYSADITRTIPVNGKFTKEQKDIYLAVLKAQKEAINLMKPDAPWRDIEEKAANTAKEELYKLGLITDPNTTWQHKIWYLHGCSHSIGLDVHDATQISFYKDGRYKENMIFTCEPGIYVGESFLDNLNKFRYPNVTEKELKEFADKVRPAAKKYNNIGVRIEDDILITKEGHKIITADCPKEVADIEKTMKQKSRFID